MKEFPLSEDDAQPLEEIKEMDKSSLKSSKKKNSIKKFLVRVNRIKEVGQGVCTVETIIIIILSVNFIIIKNIFHFKRSVNLSFFFF
jgi:hypothetical protein